MTELQYTTVDRILSKFHRDLKGTDISESDAIEWIGEALEFLKVREIQEQAVAFIEVRNFEADVPNGLHMILQIARDNDWEMNKTSTINKLLKCKQEIKKEEDCTLEIVKVEDTCTECKEYEELNSCLNIDEMVHNTGVRESYVDTSWKFQSWASSNIYRERFTNIRLANHIFFKSVVCREKTPYDNCGTDEYTIVGTAERKLRFSFQEGAIALAYIRNAIDNETGYPLVPDQISYITAITYYVKWKIAERMSWDGREGFARLSQDSERLWLKYANQSKNFMKMPKGLDIHQDLLEQSHYLIPRHKRYYGYFGHLGKAEDRPFNHPNN